MMGIDVIRGLHGYLTRDPSDLATTDMPIRTNARRKFQDLVEGRVTWGWRPMGTRGAAVTLRLLRDEREWFLTNEDRAVRRFCTAEIWNRSGNSQTVTEQILEQMRLAIGHFKGRWYYDNGFGKMEQLVVHVATIESASEGTVPPVDDSDAWTLTRNVGITVIHEQSLTDDAVASLI